MSLGVSSVSIAHIKNTSSNVLICSQHFLMSTVLSFRKDVASTQNELVTERARLSITDQQIPVSVSMVAAFGVCSPPPATMEPHIQPELRRLFKRSFLFLFYSSPALKTALLSCSEDCHWLPRSSPLHHYLSVTSDKHVKLSLHRKLEFRVAPSSYSRVHSSAYFLFVFRPWWISTGISC